LLVLKTIGPARSVHACIGPAIDAHHTMRARGCQVAGPRFPRDGMAADFRQPTV